MQEGRPQEPPAKAQALGARDPADRISPARGAGRVGEERGQRELGALKGHRQAIAGEGRNGGAGVADPYPVRSLHAAVAERRGRDAVGIAVDVRLPEPGGEAGQAGRREVGREQVHTPRLDLPLGEDAADIDVARLDPR